MKNSIKKCEICDKSFKDINSLPRHMKNVHGRHRDKVYQCNICTNSFEETYYLTKHIKYAHGQHRHSPGVDHECGYCTMILKLKNKCNNEKKALFKLIFLLDHNDII